MDKTKTVMVSTETKTVTLKTKTVKKCLESPDTSRQGNASRLLITGHGFVNLGLILWHL